MPIPRRVLVVLAGAATTAGILFLRNRLQARAQRTGSSPSAANDDSGVSNQNASGDPSSSNTSSTSSVTSAETTTPAHGGGSKGPGALGELAQFLAGETWHDEHGWRAVWQRDGIDQADAWLRTRGRGVLGDERKKLMEHPALLAGCRRRWIVVCRYAGIDVGEAATLWDQATELGSAARA